MTMNELQTTPAPAAAKKQKVLAALAARFNVEPEVLNNVLKETIAPKATEAQLAAFCIVCHEYGLNPMLKEIYAFPGRNGEIVPMVGVDGWLHLMNAHPQFDGLNTTMSDDGSSCTATIYRKDRAHPITVTEYLSECQRGTEPWKTSPRRMLRHKAIIQAARVAFGFSGIYDEDEAKDVEPVAAQQPMRNVTPREEALSRLPQPVRSRPEPPPAQKDPAYDSGALDWLTRSLKGSGMSWPTMYKALDAAGYTQHPPLGASPEELGRFAAALQADADMRSVLELSGLIFDMI